MCKYCILWTEYPTGHMTLHWLPPQPHCMQQVMIKQTHMIVAFGEEVANHLRHYVPASFSWLAIAMRKPSHVTVSHAILVLRQSSQSSTPRKSTIISPTAPPMTVETPINGPTSHRTMVTIMASCIIHSLLFRRPILWSSVLACTTEFAISTRFGKLSSSIAHDKNRDDSKMGRWNGKLGRRNTDALSQRHCIIDLGSKSMLVSLALQDSDVGQLW